MLGAILLDNEMLAKAIELLKPEHFFHEEHQKIFASMVEMGAAATPIDLVTLDAALRAKGELGTAQDSAYRASLVDGVPRVSNLEHYAKIVRDEAARRTLAAFAETLVHDVSEGAEPIEDIRDRARLRLTELAQQNDKAAQIFDTWEEFQDAKPLRPLITNFLWADVANVIGGLSTEGKTWIMLACVKALLSGEKLFGYFEVTEPLERCGYLIPECGRGPFFARAKILGLDRYIANGRLLARTLNKGPLSLDDARLLRTVKGACVLIDTAVRFSEGDESNAADVANGIGTKIFGLLAAGAACVLIAQHSPKSFAKETYISLENVLRGSGDFGALVGAGFGLRQIDKGQNIIHLEDIKPRDAELVAPFQIIGRPHLDKEGDFRIHREPGACGKLAEYLEDLPTNHGRNRGGAPDAVRESKAANLELLRRWLQEDPNQSSEQLSSRFKALGINVSPVTVRRYKQGLK